ncbi:hypothetical protein ASPZODRAFT_161632 [Penicilliopsis zonata CBS 506.65]|uniref:DNA-(apurinic or apyrimidinic site) endonuclease 2 n=1 Tax=Penicilliopsis zonata CBS 506.65 TaxID=1073090 RepID=A0A1L9S8C6_9EURO|nr:hypothetical protein ASPZODRAFT_161632 [Penicilliopsis zonata CBS 506.65]OJJ43407.1 hypothetical protein ASPZODRAFT_161632 [Penicilliopsis zonata CBS 506.65]
MGFRITTWNVNGIRNPFSYEPWRGKRTFEAMFDILEADIVIFQETKIQRKDLRDDMVLVPGWDCYFSLPRIKKGYSGVVIYTRNATCAPIRAEEGLTGTLCAPNSSVPFRDLPEDQQIGGYPTIEQLSSLELDAATIDCEGRCVVLEFPAFVVIGVYAPANRDETRDSFRLCFLDVLEARVRNLVAMGKRVFVAGDINIAREEIDSAHLAEAIRKGTATEDEFITTPARRVFNQLLSGGKVIGERDEGRERPVLHDICRSFHPNRKGMYTCWEQRINARPGNYGARIDYVLCSLDMKDWFCDSNIQEGLMGSDHCPVYAVLKESVSINGTQTNIRDLMNSPGMFLNGERRQEFSNKNYLPLSGRLIPEFDKRRNIKDMFSRTPTSTLQKSASSMSTAEIAPSTPNTGPATQTSDQTPKETPSTLLTGSSSYYDKSARSYTRKRPEKDGPPLVPSKKSKSASVTTPGQSTLKGFFKPKNNTSATGSGEQESSEPKTGSATDLSRVSSFKVSAKSESTVGDSLPTPAGDSAEDTPRTEALSASADDEIFIDPIVSKEDWTKLFTKKPVPRCEFHQEPCIRMTTKKPGINCGRSFWICSRPLGPSGNKEKGTQWRCPTFIWASDWNPAAQ